jgi:glycosyltransferase involved in cell wall biosynthesis
VAVEAIASGRWVVASAIGGLPEIIQDGLNGTLVRDGDFARALAQVPDYDPWVVASTAVRFDLASHREAMAHLWGDLVARRHDRAVPSS